MPSPICPFCKGAQFALSTERLVGATVPFGIVRCATCDAPFGAVYLGDVAATLQNTAMLLGDKLDDLRRSVGALAQDVDSLKSRPTP
jgi:hypothetical protein